MSLKKCLYNMMNISSMNDLMKKIVILFVKFCARGYQALTREAIA